MVLWPCVKGRWFDPILILLFATCSRFVYNRWRIQSHSAESVTWRFWWTLTRSSRLSHNRGGRCLLRCCGCGLWYLGCDLWHRGWHCWPCNTPSPPHSSKRNQEKDYSEKLVQILVWLNTLFFSFLLFISRVNTNYTTKIISMTYWRRACRLATPLPPETGTDRAGCAAEEKANNDEIFKPNTI